MRVFLGQIVMHAPDCLFRLQGAFASLHIPAVIIVKPVGYVRRLLNFINDAAFFQRMGICAIPVFDTADQAKLLAFPDTSLSVTKDAKNKDMAMKFLEYMACHSAEKRWGNARERFCRMRMKASRISCS